MAIVLLLALPAHPGWAEHSNGDGRGAQAAGADSNEGERRIVHGPLAVPDGLSYEAWKGIQYTSQTAFGVNIFWYPYFDKERNRPSEAELAAKGYTLDPEIPVSEFRIASAEARPIGGEMKLRSGGFVEITIRTTTTVEVGYQHDGSVGRDQVRGMIFSDSELHPFDRYTGFHC